MPERIHPTARITSVRFRAYKALADYTISLSSLNLLVGENNCGKSTIIGAFRALDHALRSSKNRRPTTVTIGDRDAPGWAIAAHTLPIAYENIHTDYGDVNSSVEFNTSPRGKLTLHFPADGGCWFLAQVDGVPVRRRVELNRELPLDIHIVPVLGPLEADERLVTQATVQANLPTIRASRNFRNYWLKHPDGFDEFAAMVSRTWPSMEVQRPERQGSNTYMFCLENRISREVYWSGFGFQIWLQLLTHIFRATDDSLIVIDEPEIYLHPNVQRQLLSILREKNSDVLLATHSTEIMAEADPSELLYVDKSHTRAKRLRTVDDVQNALDNVGSAQNITLTRVAMTRKLLYVEGNGDFKLLRTFARRLGMSELSAGIELTAVESGGFSSWQEVRALASGFERALDIQLNVAALFDRDFWCCNPPIFTRSNE